MDKVFRALADPSRRRILQMLRLGPMSAGDICEGFIATRPTMSAHLSVLKEAELVRTTRSGKQIIYELQLSVLEDALLGFAGLFGVGETPVSAARQQES